MAATAGAPAAGLLTGRSRRLPLHRGYPRACRGGWAQKERWAPQWTDDELVCIRTVNNTVQIFRNGDFGPGGRTVLTVERIGRASLAPVSGQRVPSGLAPSQRTDRGSARWRPQCGRPSYRGKTGGTRPLLATFVPENKATPASVKLVSLNENNAAVAAKTFFQAREAEMHWSPKGTDVVVNASILNASSLYLVAEQVRTVRAGRRECPSRPTWALTRLACTVGGRAPAARRLSASSCLPPTFTILRGVQTDASLWWCTGRRRRS